MVNQICQEIDNGSYSPKVRTITEKGDVPYPNAYFNLNGRLHGGGTFQLLQDGIGRLLGEINLAQLRKFEDFLFSQSKAPSTYRDIKNNPHWQAIYQYQDRAIFYLDRSDTLTHKVRPSIPCVRCRILLPEKLITIDHFGAKKGNPLVPIYRVFRVCGYTEDRELGHKARELQELIGTAAGGSLAGGNGSYALNAVGVIVYSLIAGSSYNGNLRESSMHHVLNLRPVCSHCNSSLGVH